MTQGIYRICIAGSVSLCCLITNRTTLAQNVPKAALPLNPITIASAFEVNSEIFATQARETNNIAVPIKPQLQPGQSLTFGGSVELESDGMKASSHQVKVKEKPNAASARLAAKGGKGPRKR